MDTTTNLNLPIPNENAVPPTNISAEFPRIALAFVMLDTIIHTLQGVVAGKANSEHSQAISTITGLTEALASKMPANATFSLDDLTDVQGATEALVNYVLVKKASGQWEPSSALAALGVHNHAISEVVGLADVLVALDTAITTKADATPVSLALANRLRFDVAQELTEPQKTLARNNIDFTPALVAYNRWKRIGGVRTTGTVFNHTALGEFRRITIDGSIRSVSTAGFPTLQFSSDNGATWITTASYDWLYAYHFHAGTAGSIGALDTGNKFLANANLLGSQRFSRFKIDIGEFNVAFPTSYHNLYFAYTSAPSYISGEMPGHQIGSIAMNALRILCSQNMEADYELMGLPT